MTNIKTTKPIRRWVTLILCLVLTLSSLAVLAAGAETDIKLSASDKEVTAGNYVTVYLSAENFSNVGALDLYAFYDPEVMTVVGSSKQAVAQNAQVSINTDTPGEACFSAVSTDGMSGTGRIWSIRFKVNGDTPSGRYPITFAAGDAFDLSLNAVSIGGTTCYVTVNAATPSVKTVQIAGRNYNSGYKKGDRVTLAYYAYSVEDLTSADFTLTYDETLLAPLSVSLGDPLKSANGALWSINDGTPGYVKISYASLSGVWGFVDPIVTATFEVIGEVERDSSSTVTLEIENIYDSALTTMKGSKANATVSLLWNEPEVILPEISLGDYEAIERDVFTVSVLAPGSTGLAAGDFVLTYDPTLLQCTAVESRDPACMVVSNVKQKDGKVLFSFICEDGITKDTELVRMTFKVLNCYMQSTTLPLTGKNLVDADFDPIEVTYTSLSEFPILQHQLTAFEAQKPTCETVGWHSYEACSRCSYTTYSEIPPLGHKHEAIVTQPTCTDEGYTTHTCVQCGDSYTDTPVPALGHRVWMNGLVWVDTVVIENDTVYPFLLHDGVYSSTNKSAGSDSYLTVTAQYTCALEISYAVSSEYGYDRLIIRLNGGTILDISGQTEWRSQVLALTAGDVLTVNYHKDSCTDNGKDTGWFAFDAEQKEISQKICVSADDLNPTCTEAVVCNFCEAIVKNAWGHTPNAPVVENRIEPTCTEQGSYDSVVYCSVCNAELTREEKTIAALGHAYSPDWTVDLAPTCTEVGSKSRHCERCNDRTEITEISANGHSFGEWYEITAPTCTETGVDEQKCSVCGHTERRVTEALGHISNAPVVENRVDPTCTVQGSYDSVVYCSVCNEELTREEKTIDALGHIPNAPVVENRVAPTCTEQGSYDSVVYCSVCNEELTREEKTIDLLGHNYNAVVTAPTCIEKGYTTHTCSRCNDTYVYIEVAELGHKPGTEADCLKDQICTICGEVLVEKLGHNYNAAVTAPTCTEKGYTAHTCSRCNDSYIDSEVDALGHTPSDWIVDQEPAPGIEGAKYKTCTVCGETLETAVIDALPVETEPIIEPATEPETETPTEIPTDSITEPSLESDVTTDKETNADTEKAPQKNGCSGSIYSYASLLLLILAVMPLFIKTKKENE